VEARHPIRAGIVTPHRAHHDNRMWFHRPQPRNPPLDAEFYAAPGRAVFLTIRCSARIRPFVTVPLNNALIAALLAQRRRSRCALYAYCLMPDHLHFLAAPASEDASVLDLLRRFKGISTRIAWRFGCTGRLWQPRYYDRVLRRDEAVERVAEYIIHNPVRAGLVAEPDDFRWGDLVDPMQW
jgi:putative transposase